MTIEMNNKMLKKGFVILLGAALYVRGLYHGYLDPQRGGWMFATALLYIMMHYVTLSRSDTVHKYRWFVLMFVLIITGIVITRTGSVWIGLSVLLRHAALRGVMHSLENILSTRKKFKKSVFFQAGGALFSIFFTLSFITAFIGRNEKFNLTCDDIYDAGFAVVNYSEEKFNVGWHQIEAWQAHMLGEVISGTGDEVELPEGLSGFDDGSFAAMLQTYKQQLIDETIAKQKDVNQRVCQVFVDQIKDLYQKPSFRVSVIILMFLVISPLLRITLFIISGINILLFMILKKLGAYTITKETVEVDKVE